MKCLGVALLPPGWDASLLQVTPLPPPLPAFCWYVFLKIESFRAAFSRGCALRKFLGSPLGSQPCQLGCPALKVGRPPPPKKKRKKKRIFFGSSQREVFRNESISQFIFFKTHVVITLQATNKCLLLFIFPFQRTHKFC